MDFTLKKYKTLLNKLSNSDYRFQTFADFLEKPERKVIILRHDVDDKKMNALRFAEIQHDLGISGSYYFRMVPQSYDPEVIKKIADLGHEIGYHYEDLDLASSKFKVQSSKLKENDLEEIAIGLFEKNLKKLREIYPVKTICMHGSPRSKIDNKSLWKRYSYRDFGIIGEPYFDIDFNKVLYLTDTGRRWDGEKVSIRDKVSSSKFNVRSLEFNDTVEKKRTANPFLSTEKVNHRFRSTHDIIKAALVYNLPDKIMITFHPQRWTDKPLPWLKELLYQNFKNQIKKFYIKQT
jgi:hypothetical protein